MAELPPGRRGTARLDPNATVPEATPLRFADGHDALAASDREDLARSAADQQKALKPQQPQSDRQEFASQALRPGQRGPTLELRKVDVSRADPRKMATVKGRGLTYDPSLDAEPGEPVAPAPSRMFLVVAVAIGLAVIVAAIVFMKNRAGH